VLTARLHADQNVLYWETHRQSVWELLGWLGMLTIFLLKALFDRSRLYVVLFLAFIALRLLAYLLDRIRTSVTSEKVSVRGGIKFLFLPLHPLVLPTTEITDVDIYTPVKEDKISGYQQYDVTRSFAFTLNTRYVRIVTRSGDKYLIGSDHPDKLATAIRAVMTTSH
jgi:hypothetical protein